jgi:hypothetical protein
MKILVTGGTGFIGRRLCAALGAAGHDLRVPTRDPRRASDGLPRGTEVLETPAPDDGKRWSEAVAGCDAIVNLAGESIAAGRWTEARKRAIAESRVATTRALVDACRVVAGGPDVLVSGSAVGYYGPHGDEELTEQSPPGDDFLARVCIDWEAEAVKAEAIGIRVVRLRLGVVLGHGGGALERMAAPFRFWAGGPVGSGRQWLSWIHLDDAVGLARFALERRDLQGAMNATAPDPRTMRDFSRALGEALGRPSWLPVPAFALRLGLGEMADMLLLGQRVVPAVARGAGFAFRYPDLGSALGQALG